MAIADLRKALEFSGWKATSSAEYTYSHKDEPKYRAVISPGSEGWVIRYFPDCDRMWDKTDSFTTDLAYRIPELRCRFICHKLGSVGWTSAKGTAKFTSPSIPYLKCEVHTSVGTHIVDYQRGFRAKQTQEIFTPEQILKQFGRLSEIELAHERLAELGWINMLGFTYKSADHDTSDGPYAFIEWLDGERKKIYYRFRYKNYTTKRMIEKPISSNEMKSIAALADDRRVNPMANMRRFILDNMKAKGWVQSLGGMVPPKDETQHKGLKAVILDDSSGIEYIYENSLFVRTSLLYTTAEAMLRLLQPDVFKEALKRKGWILMKDTDNVFEINFDHNLRATVHATHISYIANMVVGFHHVSKLALEYTKVRELANEHVLHNLKAKLQNVGWSLMQDNTLQYGRMRAEVSSADGGAVQYTDTVSSPIIVFVGSGHAIMTPNQAFDEAKRIQRIRDEQKAAQEKIVKDQQDGKDTLQAALLKAGWTSHIGQYSKNGFFAEIIDGNTIEYTGHKYTDRVTFRIKGHVIASDHYLRERLRDMPYGPFKLPPHYHTTVPQWRKMRRNGWLQIERESALGLLVGYQFYTEHGDYEAKTNVDGTILYRQCSTNATFTHTRVFHPNHLKAMFDAIERKSQVIVKNSGEAKAITFIATENIKAGQAVVIASSDKEMIAELQRRNQRLRDALIREFARYGQAELRLKLIDAIERGESA